MTAMTQVTLAPLDEQETLLASVVKDTAQSSVEPDEYLYGVD